MNQTIQDIIARRSVKKYDTDRFESHQVIMTLKTADNVK